MNAAEQLPNGDEPDFGLGMLGVEPHSSAMNAVMKARGEAAPAVSLADRVMASIRGGQEAQRVLDLIRQGTAGPDDLFDGLLRVQEAGDPEQVRGYMREVAKRLERSVW